MGVETDHEEEREVVGIPEGLEALVADLVVGRGIHEDHDEKHEVTSDASGLVVVDLQGDFRPDLCRTESRIVSGSCLTQVDEHMETYGCAQR